jgi:hypothetical protein
MAQVEKRKSPMRRQMNEAFCDPLGKFSISKFLAVWAQIAILAHMNRWFEELISKPESLLIVLSFLIAPEIIKKALVMKLGGSVK